MGPVHYRRRQCNRLCTDLTNEKRAVTEPLHSFIGNNLKRRIETDHLLVVKEDPLTHMIGFEVPLKALESLNFTLQRGHCCEKHTRHVTLVKLNRTYNWL